MLNNIAIGTTVSLDLQTRALIRVSDGKSVNLPASASLCLQALVEARGEVLSQEQLMDIGWRSMGVEVTDNSVRVMINKLRRALNELELQDDLTLLAVTRSGYRLIIHDSGIDMDAPPPEAVPQEAVQEIASVATVQPKLSAPPPKITASATRWRTPLLAIVAGMLAGLIVGLIVHHTLIVAPERVDFVRWTGNNIPPQAEVWVQKGKQQHQALIEATLETYTRYVLDKRPHNTLGNVLYITMGAALSHDHQGLMACQQPLQEAQNECEAFYFHVY